MYIRKERDGDAEIISRIQYAAFKDHPQHQPGAEPTEHLIVERLRDAGALTLSLVLIENSDRTETMVGHIVMSPASVGQDAEGWYLLGPVGLLPEFQGNGYGSALVRAALDEMKGRGAKGIVLVGDPAFYQRFGFTSRPGLTFGPVPPEYVLGLSFGSQAPLGEVGHHPAFGC